MNLAAIKIKDLRSECVNNASKTGLGAAAALNI